LCFIKSDFDESESNTALPELPKPDDKDSQLDLPEDMKLDDTEAEAGADEDAEDTPAGDIEGEFCTTFLDRSMCCFRGREASSTF